MSRLSARLAKFARATSWAPQASSHHQPRIDVSSIVGEVCESKAVRPFTLPACAVLPCGSRTCGARCFLLRFLGVACDFCRSRGTSWLSRARQIMGHTVLCSSFGMRCFPGRPRRCSPASCELFLLCVGCVVALRASPKLMVPFPRVHVRARARLRPGGIGEAAAVERLATLQASVAAATAALGAPREAGEVAWGAYHKWQWDLWNDARYFARQCDAGRRLRVLRRDCGPHLGP